MTGLTDVRDRTLTMLRALGVEPDRKQMRTVEKYHVVAGRSTV